MNDNEQKLEYKIGERNYQFLCSKDSPIHEVGEALHAFQGHLWSLIKNHFDPQPEEKEQDNGQPV